VRDQIISDLIGSPVQLLESQCLPFVSDGNGLRRPRDLQLKEMMQALPFDR
jgi:hypothetical protein